MPAAGQPCMVSRTWVLKPMGFLLNVLQLPRNRLFTKSVYNFCYNASMMIPMETSSTTAIAEALTRAIVEHKLMPGTKLAEQKLADHFGVSRTLVRQALFQLSQNKLIKLEPARGAFVATPSVDEARQVFAVRRMLEAEMVRSFMMQSTSAKIRALKAHVAVEKKAMETNDVGQRTELLG